MVTALAGVVRAADVPMNGARLTLRVDSTDLAKRVARFTLSGDAVRAPFPDPREGARLILSGGIRSGQCRVDVPLDPTKWRPLAGDGPGRGYRYVDRAGTVAGIRSLTIRAGRISMRAGTARWPCAVDATSERLPVTVDLYVGGERYCAEFGGVVLSNQRQRFTAVTAPAPAVCGKRDVTVANLNVLHGLDCSIDTRGCRINDRAALLFRWVGVGCPDVVTFQEIFRSWSTLIAGYQPIVCPFAYSRVSSITGIGVDDQLILSRYPVVEQEVLLLYRDFRSLTYARIDHPIGPLDVVTTHLASSADRGDAPCVDDCPRECVAAGAATVRDCQAVQVAQYVDLRHDVDGPALVTGDFNAPPGSFVYEQFTGRGWIDAYLAASNPECDPLTGIGCTSGSR